MSSLRRRGLQIDDPLGPEPSSQPEASATRAAGAGDASESARARNEQPTTQPGRAPQGGAQRTADRTAPTDAPPRSLVGEPAGQAAGGVWRTWSGITAVGSFRLPHELLDELGDTARDLRLPIGMIVTAALTQLLDQPAHTIAGLVDRADDARIQGRRHARRRLTDREGG